MSRTSSAFWALALLIACISLGFAPAVAGEPAYVTRVGGSKVTILRGGKSMPVQPQMVIAEGEIVTAGDNSFVEVRYFADGCVLRVSNLRSLVVAKSSPCLPGEAPAEAQAEVAAVQPPARPLTEGPAVAVPPATSALAVEPETGVIARVTSKSGPLTRANFGDGLVELQTGAGLKPGDRVFAGQNSSITIYFPRPDCRYVVQPETYLEIRNVPPCDAGAPPPAAGSAAVGAEAGIAAGAAAALGAGALAVLLLGQEDDEGNPATPN